MAKQKKPLIFGKLTDIIKVKEAELEVIDLEIRENRLDLGLTEDDFADCEHRQNFEYCRDCCDMADLCLEKNKIDIELRNLEAEKESVMHRGPFGFYFKKRDELAKEAAEISEAIEGAEASLRGLKAKKTNTEFKIREIERIIEDLKDLL